MKYLKFSFVNMHLLTSSKYWGENETEVSFWVTFRELFQSISIVSTCIILCFLQKLNKRNRYWQHVKVESTYLSFDKVSKWLLSTASELFNKVTHSLKGKLSFNQVLSLLWLDLCLISQVSSENEK